MKYVYNITPYLGQPKVATVKYAAHDIVTSLVQPFLYKGYNVTMDYYFPSMPLIKELNSQHTILVGV